MNLSYFASVGFESDFGFGNFRRFHRRNLIYKIMEKSLDIAS
jgi:hypothetical protein